HHGERHEWTNERLHERTPGSTILGSSFIGRVRGRDRAHAGGGLRCPDGPTRPPASVGRGVSPGQPCTLPLDGSKLVVVVVVVVVLVVRCLVIPLQSPRKPADPPEDQGPPCSAELVDAAVQAVGGGPPVLAAVVEGDSNAPGTIRRVSAVVAD